MPNPKAPMMPMDDESHDDFMKRCMDDGGDNGSCQMKWDDAHKGATGRSPKMTTVTAPVSWKALQQEKADLIREATDLMKAPLTPEGRKRDDEIAARLEEIGADLARYERHKALTAANASNINITVGTVGDVALRTNPQGAKDSPFPTLGHQLQAVMKATVKHDPEALDGLMNMGRYRADATGMGVAVDSDGGFLLHPTFSTAIRQRMTLTGKLLARMQPIPLDPGSDRLELVMVDETSRADGSRYGGVQGYWVEEGEAPTAKKAKLAKLALKLHKVAGAWYASDELMRNAAAMSELASRSFGDELRFMCEDAIFRGSGAGQPQGFMNSPALVTVAKETGQTADTITHDNLKKMWSRLDVRSEATALWLINKDCEPTLDDLAKTIGTGGVEPRYVDYGPSGVLRIKGAPVEKLEYSASIGDLGDIVLVDLAQYAWIAEGGIQEQSSMHVKFLEGEMTFKVTWRVDGGGLWKSALTPYKGSSSTTTSPFVALAAR